MVSRPSKTAEASPTIEDLVVVVSSNTTAGIEKSLTFEELDAADSSIAIEPPLFVI